MGTCGDCQEMEKTAMRCEVGKAYSMFGKRSRKQPECVFLYRVLVACCGLIFF